MRSSGPAASRLVFSVTALILPALIMVQVYLAGLALFHDRVLWEIHAAAGGALALPILALLLMSWRSRALRAQRWPIALLAALYVLQFAFIMADGGWAKALHPANAAAITAVAVLIARSAWPAKE